MDQEKAILLNTLHSVSFADLQVVVNRHSLKALLLGSPKAFLKDSKSKSYFKQKRSKG